MTSRGQSVSNRGSSCSYPRSRWDLRAGGKPFAIGEELQSKLFIVDSQIAVCATRYRFRHQPLHFLRHHTDIGFIAAEIAEAVIAEAVVKVAKQSNVVLQRYVRTPATAAATESASAASVNGAAATTEAASAGNLAAPTEACLPAR